MIATAVEVVGTDLHNAISVPHQNPLGGEHLSRYHGSSRPVRADGTEPFATAADGEPAVEHPEPGEVVRCDYASVTCRRWNWRQAHRTQLRDDTTTALFIINALASVNDVALSAAADELTEHLVPLGPDVRTVRRFLTNSVACHG